jgi:hypothetical protein
MSFSDESLLGQLASLTTRVELLFSSTVRLWASYPPVFPVSVHQRSEDQVHLSCIT